MLEIIINRTDSLDLLPGFHMSLTSENPLFLDDRIPAPYSLSFEVPPTANNLKILGYPNRVASNIVNRNLPAEIRHTGMIIASGELLLLETQKTLKLQFKGSLEDANVRSNLNEIECGVYDYGSFPPVISAADYYMQSWATNYKNNMKLAAGMGSQFVVAPVKVTSDAWYNMDSRNGALNAVRQYINFFNPHDDECFMLKVQDESLNQYYINHTAIFPFPYIKNILDAGFGGKLLNNPFTTGDLAKLVAVTFNNPNFDLDTLLGVYGIPPRYTNSVLPLVDSYAQAGSPPLCDLKISVKNFMQEYSFASFLKNLLSIFSMTAYPGTKYSIESNNDIFDRTVIVDWDKKLVGELLISQEKGKEYQFSYGSTSESEDIANKSFANGHNVFDYMANTNSPESDTVKDNVTGTIWDIIRTITSPFSRTELASSVKKSAFSVAKSKSNTIHNVTSDITPLDMSIEKFWWEDDNWENGPLQKHHWFVPVMDRKEITAAPNIAIYAGMAETFEGDDHTYPLLLNHHTDQFGVKRQDLSLLPDGPDGIIAVFHNKMKAWVEKDKLRVRGLFRFNLQEFRKINLRDKISLKGRLFYIEKFDCDLLESDISLLDVNLIEC